MIFSTKGLIKNFMICIVTIILCTCSENLKLLYKLDNKRGIYAEILSSHFNYYLVFKNYENIVISKHKVGIGTLESDISSAMWDNNGNFFALKICGEGNQVFIYTYDVKRKKIKEYYNPKKDAIPSWITFSVKAGFNLSEDVKIKEYE